MIFVFADMTETAVEALQEVKPTKESGEAGAERDKEKRERGPRRQQPRRPRQAGQDGKAAEVEDAAIEAEFTMFVNKMKAKYPGNSVAYQINNFPEGLECTFRLARQTAPTQFTASFLQNKKKSRELTDEQKEKLAAKREKEKEKRAKKREAKLRRKGDDEEQEEVEEGVRNMEIKEEAKSD